MATSIQATPVEVIANVTRIVTTVTDRICGDRSGYPLLVSLATAHALKNHGIQSQVVYGQGAWVEVTEDGAVLWSGCWGENVTFWVVTEFNECVDLNTSVAFRKRFHSQPDLIPKVSAPLLWSKDIPNFYRYRSDGVAEVEITEERDQKWLEQVLREVDEKCRPELLTLDEDFPNEPVLCNRKLLDDSRESFAHFDRTLAVVGMPDRPF
jgi:hypothetical protein